MFPTLRRPRRRAKADEDTRDRDQEEAIAAGQASQDRLAGDAGVAQTLSGHEQLHQLRAADHQRRAGQPREPTASAHTPIAAYGSSASDSAGTTPTIPVTIARPTTTTPSSLTGRGPAKTRGNSQLDALDTRVIRLRPWSRLTGWRFESCRGCDGDAAI